MIKESLIAQGVARELIGFIGEEDGLDTKGKFLFAFDPIDGRTNFASGLDYFVISVGCFIDGELFCGVVYEPATKNMYWAEKGNGTYKSANGARKQLNLIFQVKQPKNFRAWFHW